MKICILLGIEDINTNIIGSHVEVSTANGTLINFTKEAAEELLNDLTLVLPELKL